LVGVGECDDAEDPGGRLAFAFAASGVFAESSSEILSAADAGGIRLSSSAVWSTAGATTSSLVLVPAIASPPVLSSSPKGFLGPANAPNPLALPLNALKPPEVGAAAVLTGTAGVTGDPTAKLPKLPRADVLPKVGVAEPLLIGDMLTAAELTEVANPGGALGSMFVRGL
jgi:hypothetical protein